MKSPKLAIVVPCYNEQEVVAHTCKALIDKLYGLIDSSVIAKDSFICFVDDGSRDKTWEILKSHIKSLESSSNSVHSTPPPIKYLTNHRT